MDLSGIIKIGESHTWDGASIPPLGLKRSRDARDTPYRAGTELTRFN